MVNKEHPIRVVVMTPIKPGMPAGLVSRFYHLLGSQLPFLYSVADSVSIIMDDCGIKLPDGVPHMVRAAYLRRIRDRMVTEYGAGVLPRKKLNLKNIFILWVDADIISATDGLLASLLQICLEDPARLTISSPMVLLEPGPGVGEDRWYDLAGFIHDGTRAIVAKPWFPASAYQTQVGSRLFLNGSVGCVYCVPLSLYHLDGALDGGNDLDPRLTEHYPVCHAAISAGGKCVVDLALRVYHAHLPLWGESFH